LEKTRCGFDQSADEQLVALLNFGTFGNLGNFGNASCLTPLRSVAAA
jgi:hypothetical protein